MTGWKLNNLNGNELNATRILFNGAKIQLFIKCVPALANDE